MQGNATNADLEFVSVADAAEICHVSVFTIKRWMAKGYRGVRLPAWQIGTRSYTSRDGLAEFIQAMSRQRGYQDEVADMGAEQSGMQPAVSRPQRTRQIEAADRQAEMALA